MEKKTIHNPVETVKDRILNTLFLVFTLLSFPLILSSISRSNITGWEPIYTFHITVAVVLGISLVFYRKLSRIIKAYILIAILSIAAFFGMYTFGYFASAKLFMIFIPIIAALLINRKSGYIFLGVFVLSYTLITYLYISGNYAYNFNLNDYVNKPDVWISTGLAIVLISLGLMIIINKYEDAYKYLLSDMRDKEENYRLLFEQSADGIISTNAQGEILNINQSFSAISGYTKEELIGRNSNILFKAEELEENPLHNKLILKGETVTNTSKGLRKDGTEVDIEIRTRNLSDGRIQTIVRNISESIENERKLKESELMYRTLFDNAHDAIFLLKDNKFIDCNRKALELFECRMEDLIGNDPLLFSPEFQPDGRLSQEAIITNERKVFQGQPQLFEWKHITLNGEVFDAEVSLNKYVVNEEYYIQGLVRDISEKKQLNRKLYMASMQAEEAERERLARDLHDGLGPLLSTSKIYLHNIKENENAEDEEKYIKKLGQTLDEALTGIKEISNNISPHILRNFGLTQAVKNYIQKLDTPLNVTIDCTIPDDQRYSETIEVTIYRIVNELINNSLKYSGASEITLKLMERGGNIFLSYTDNGKGFGYNEAIEKRKGFGLLNIQSRVQALNGDHKYKTKPGEGVDVEIILSV